MAETTTARHGWTKPDPGASSTTWGTTQNGTIDKIDEAVFAVEQGITPIGGVIMFAGTVAPANWLICDGRSLPTGPGGAYDALFAAIRYTNGGSGGNFNIPGSTQRFPLGAGPNAPGSVGGGFSYTIGTGNMPPHSHTIQDPSHYHTITDQAHGHGVNQWAHSHTVGVNNHGHSLTMNAHAHSGNLMRFIGGSGQPLGIHGGIEANVQYGNTDSNGSSGSADAVGNFGGWTHGPTSSISVQNSGSNIGNTDWGGTRIGGTDNTGSGTPLSIVPPFFAINFIIRYQ